MSRVTIAADDVHVTGSLRSLTIGRPGQSDKPGQSKVRLSATVELSGPYEDIESELLRLQQAVTESVTPKR